MMFRVEYGNFCSLCTRIVKLVFLTIVWSKNCIVLKQIIFTISYDVAYASLKPLLSRFENYKKTAIPIPKSYEFQSPQSTTI